MILKNDFGRCTVSSPTHHSSHPTHPRTPRKPEGRGFPTPRVPYESDRQITLFRDYVPSGRRAGSRSKLSSTGEPLVLGEEGGESVASSRADSFSGDMTEREYRGRLGGSSRNGTERTQEETSRQSSRCGEETARARKEMITLAKHKADIEGQVCIYM